MKTNTKPLILISYFVVMLVVLYIVPSGVFAAANDPTFASGQNVTEENFIDFQTNLLVFISEQIAELQNFYNNVGKASNSSELQEVLSLHIQTSGNQSTGMNKQPYRMNNESCGISGFDLYQVENVTDNNYTDIQLKIVYSLKNTTEILKTEQINLLKAGENEKAKELGEMIVNLECLSTNVSEASNAAKLQEVVLIYIKTQAFNSIEREIEHIEAKVSDIENTTVGLTDDIIKLDDKISELTAQREKINEAKSFSDLKKIIPTSREIVGIDIVCSTQIERCEGYNCPVCHPVKTQDNSTDNNTCNPDRFRYLIE